MILVMTATIQMPSEFVVGEWPRPYKWTRDEYHRLADLGLFAGHRVQLIDGEIIEMSPQGSPHYVALTLATRALEAAFGAGYWVRPQGPLSLSKHSEPEPDVSVVKGSPRIAIGHPATAELVVEVSDTSLSFDLGPKSRLYAGTGILDYWVLDLQGRKLIVHRQPVADAAAPLGHRYADVRTLGPTDSIAPLSKPDAVVQIADLLP